MYDIIKNVIKSGEYELKDILYKINKMYVESAITEEQKTELDNLAREKANASNSYAPIQEQIDNIYKEMEQIKNRVDVLEGKEEPEEEYPEYKEPTGAHDAYNRGDKVTFKNKKYECLMDNCVWDPETYPSAWREIEE